MILLFITNWGLLWYGFSSSNSSSFNSSIYRGFDDSLILYGFSFGMSISSWSGSPWIVSYIVRPFIDLDMSLHSLKDIESFESLGLNVRFLSINFLVLSLVLFNLDYSLLMLSKKASSLFAYTLKTISLNFLWYSIFVS